MKSNKPKAAKKIRILPIETTYFQHQNNQQLQAVNNVCALVSQGMAAYKAIDQLNQISRNEFYNILFANSDLQNNYARATEEREVVMFNKALDVAMDGSNDWYVNEKGATVPNPVTVQRARLASDIILRMLATMNHKKYGSRLNVEANVNVMQPLTMLEADEILKQLE